MIYSLEVKIKSGKYSEIFDSREQQRSCIQILVLPAGFAHFGNLAKMIIKHQFHIRILTKSLPLVIR